MKDRGFGPNQRLQEKFEDTKRVIGIRKSNDKSANNDLQSTTQETKVRATRSPLNTRG